MDTRILAVAQSVAIKPPKFQIAEIRIVGTAPYCQNRMSQKASNMMIETQKAGQQSQSKRKKAPKDFEQCFRDSMYESREGWRGFPAASIRKAAISACRIVNFKMTLAKLAIFVEAEGFDKFDGTPLVRLYGDEPIMRVHPVRNATGVMDMRARAFWDNWHATLRVRFDADMFSLSDTVNLITRVGMQVGIGEGRPDSKESTGCGWGTFDVVHDASPLQ